MSQAAPARQTAGAIFLARPGALDRVIYVTQASELKQKKYGFFLFSVSPFTEDHAPVTHSEDINQDSPLGCQTSKGTRNMTPSKTKAQRAKPIEAMGHVLAWIVETDRRYRAVQDRVDRNRDF